MKRTIVMLHGWGADSSRFKLLEKELESAGYEVKTLDLPGFGEETEPSDVWGVDDFVNWLKQKLEEGDVSFPIVLLGHSFGGQIAVKFTYNFPELVERLILISPAAVRFPRTKRGWILASVVEIGKIFFSLPGLSHFYEFSRWLIYIMLRQKDYYKASSVMRKVMAKILKEDLRPIFSKIKAPTLLIWGTNDVFIPFRFHKYYLNAFPNIVFKKYNGKGHNFFYLEVESLVKDIKEFLNND